MFCVLQSFSHHFLELPIDGRNFAPVDKQFIWLFTGFHTSWVVQDFFHQQYSHNSSPVPNVSLSNRRLSVWQFEHGWGWMSRWHFRTIECLEGGHIVFWKSDFWIWLVQASSRVCLPNYCVSWFALSCLTPVKLGRQLSFCFWRRNQKKRKQNVRHSTQLFDVLDSGHPNQRGDAKSQERRFFLGSGISAGEGGVLCRSASGARSARGARGRKNVVGISQTMMCCRKSTKSKGKGVKELTDRCLKLSLAQLSWWESESGVFFRSIISGARSQKATFLKFPAEWIIRQVLEVATIWKLSKNVVDLQVLIILSILSCATEALISKKCHSKKRRKKNHSLQLQDFCVLRAW